MRGARRINSASACADSSAGIIPSWRASVRAASTASASLIAEYCAISDAEAVEAARTLARQEGIIPALESAHALAELIRRAPRMNKDELVILNLSGRGDKDMDILSRYV